MVRGSGAFFFHIVLSEVTLRPCDSNSPVSCTVVPSAARRSPPSACAVAVRLDVCLRFALRLVGYSTVLMPQLRHGQTPRTVGVKVSKVLQYKLAV